jgi:hypothetical protein
MPTSAQTRSHTPTNTHTPNPTTGKAVPQWLPERQRRNLAKDENYRRRVELIQDLDFPTASQVGLVWREAADGARWMVGGEAEQGEGGGGFDLLVD